MTNQITKEQYLQSLKIVNDYIEQETKRLDDLINDSLAKKSELQKQSNGIINFSKPINELTIFDVDMSVRLRNLIRYGTPFSWTEFSSKNIIEIFENFDLKYCIEAKRGLGQKTLKEFYTICALIGFEKKI